jgi:hypothetical protein
MMTGKQLKEMHRALKIVAMPTDERLKLFTARELDPEAVWFLEHIDDVAPELHKRGWVEYGEFKHEPGCVVLTTGQGDIRTVVATDAGRKMLNVAVRV